MTYNEIRDAVYEITGRSDRVAETARGIQSATLKAHQFDFFPKDIFEAGLQFPAAAYIQNLEYATTIPRFRAMRYLRNYDYPSNTAGRFLKMVDPSDVLDDYGAEKTNIWYLGGAEITIKSATAQQYFLIGCYLHPIILPGTYDSWVARENPFAIIYSAAASVFKAIGKDEENATYRQLVGEELILLKNSNIVPEGF